MVNFGLVAADICWRVWGIPANFNGSRVLAALLHDTLSSGRQPNFAALSRGRHLYSAWRPSRWAFGPHSSSHVLWFVSDIAVFVLKRDVKLQLTFSGGLLTLSRLNCNEVNWVEFISIAAMKRALPVSSIAADSLDGGRTRRLFEKCTAL